MTITEQENYTSSQQLQELFSQQQEAYGKHTMPSLQERIKHLKNIKAATIKYKDQLCNAIEKDFSARAHAETLITEILTSIEGYNHAIKSLKKWMKPSKRKSSILFMPSSNTVYYQPIGVVGIIVPWNFPVYMATGPLTSALAAGNRAMIKMSECTPNTNRVFKQMLSEVFDEDYVAVIQGDVDIAMEFTSLPFNHIIFTGSTNVGRHVMSSAAKNLTPVTLELGGKSPVILGRDIDCNDIAYRIAYGKSINAGQACISPDYILVPTEKEDMFVKAYLKSLKKFFPTIKNNSDFSAIIDDRQFARIHGLLDDAILQGATVTKISDEDLGDVRKIIPAVVQNAPNSAKITQEEIFAPILLVIPYNHIDDAIKYINDRPRPLALYYFGHNKKEEKLVLEGTHSGGVAINDTMKHLPQDDMPFGGIGDSGMGHYHGKEGFLTFSKSKGVYRAGFVDGAKLIQPPYNKTLLALISKLFLR
jgi:coniferyl-aldehyde dehydrogenase